jgi:hypothetical protein
MDTRTCCTCKVEKNLTEFNKNAKGKQGRHCRCKACSSIASKEIYKRLGKNYYLLGTYGITEEKLNEMYHRQQGRCAICDSLIDLSGQNKRSACIDHNHSTGEVRALLCNHCNRGLGMFLDEPKLLRLAANYLEKFN